MYSYCNIDYLLFQSFGRIPPQPSAHTYIIISSIVVLLIFFTVCVPTPSRSVF
jgi:hypothetical protein